MQEETINIKKLNEKAIVPTYGSYYAAGADLYANIDESGLSCKQGLAPANKVGVIDSDYRGELKVALYNQSMKEKIVNPNDRIAQITFMPYIKANFKVMDELNNTERGTGGFGSTGV